MDISNIYNCFVPRCTSDNNALRKRLLRNKGDPSKAKRVLGWDPMKTSFEELVELMVKHDMEKVAVERAEEHIKLNLEEYLEKGVVK